MDVRQIIALAVEKEQAAADLYGHLARHTRDPAARGLLEDLAAEELRHKGLLLGIQPEDIPAFEPEELRAPRLAQFLDVRPLSPESRLQEVLAYAIRREQEARAFYASMAERLHREDLRALFARLAAMEDKHRVGLEDLYESEFLDDT